MEEEYTDSTVHAVVSVSCVGDEALFSQCGAVTTSIETDNRCSIDSVVEVVCQGDMLLILHVLTIRNNVMLTAIIYYRPTFLFFNPQEYTFK